MSPLPIKLLLWHRDLVVAIGTGGHLRFSVLFASLTLVWCAGHDGLLASQAFSGDVDGGSGVAEEILGVVGRSGALPQR